MNLTSLIPIQGLGHKNKPLSWGKKKDKKKKYFHAEKWEDDIYKAKKLDKEILNPTKSAFLLLGHGLQKYFEQYSF